MQEAGRLFSNTSIKLTTDGQRHLGAAIGTSNFRAKYASRNGAMNSIVLPTLQKHNHMQTEPELQLVIG